MALGTPYFWHESWIRASSQPLISAVFKQKPEDFYVEESLSFVPSGSGEHLYLYVEKVNLNSEDVRKTLAAHFAVPKVDVSYAGLKDRHAVCRQWFSVRLPKSDIRSKVQVSGLLILDQALHEFKLRSHHIRANRFRITLREMSALPSFDGLEEVPNYFGPQRFGKNGRNLQSAQSWVAKSRPRIDRFRRGMYLSAMRSWIFNHVLSERLRQNSWKSSLDGEIPVDDLPTGPLWGRGRLNTKREVRDIEEKTVAEHPIFSDALEWSGTKQERRKLVCQVQGIQTEVDGSNLVIDFSLERGCYATSVLHEFVELASLQCHSSSIHAEEHATNGRNIER